MSHFPLEKLSENRAWFWPAAAVVITSFVVLAYGFMEQHDEAQDVEDARVQAQQQAQQEDTLQRLCGGAEAVYEQLPDGSIQCRMKNGRKSVKVKS
jgi:hypothetical protein